MISVCRKETDRQSLGKSRLAGESLLLAMVKGQPVPSLILEAYCCLTFSVKAHLLSLLTRNSLDFSISCNIHQPLVFSTLVLHLHLDVNNSRIFSSVSMLSRNVISQYVLLESTPISYRAAVWQLIVKNWKLQMLVWEMIWASSKFVNLYNFVVVVASIQFGFINLNFIINVFKFCKDLKIIRLILITNVLYLC